MRNIKHTLELSGSIHALIQSKIGIGPVDHEKLREELAKLIGDDPMAADTLSLFNQAYNWSDLGMAEAFEQTLGEIVLPYLADGIDVKNALTCVAAAVVFADYECCDAAIAKKIRIVYGDDDNSGKAELILRPTWWENAATLTP
jgi:hypothetical protein